MNRSTFFKTLAAGIASAPTLAKVLAEEPASPRRLPLGWRGTPQDFLGELTWIHADQIRRDGVYWQDGISYTIGRRPLRFDAK